MNILHNPEAPVYGAGGANLQPAARGGKVREGAAVVVGGWATKPGQANCPSRFCSWEERWPMFAAIAVFKRLLANKTWFLGAQDLCEHFCLCWVHYWPEYTVRPGKMEDSDAVREQCWQAFILIVLRILFRMGDKTTGCENLDLPEPTRTKHREIKEQKMAAEGGKTQQFYTDLRTINMLWKLTQTKDRSQGGKTKRLCYTELRKMLKNKKCSKRRKQKTTSKLIKNIIKIRSLFFRGITKNMKKQTWQQIRGSWIRLEVLGTRKYSGN